MAMKSSTCMEGGRLVFCFLMRKMSFLPIARRCSIAGGGEEEERESGEGGRVNSLPIFSRTFTSLYLL